MLAHWVRRRPSSAWTGGACIGPGESDLDSKLERLPGQLILDGVVSPGCRSGMESVGAPVI